MITEYPRASWPTAPKKRQRRDQVSDHRQGPLVAAILRPVINPNATVLRKERSERAGRDLATARHCTHEVKIVHW
jgi:hypothetical protein